MFCKRMCNTVKQKKTFPSHQQEWNNLNYFHGDRNEDSQISEGLAGGWELGTVPQRRDDVTVWVSVSSCDDQLKLIVLIPLKSRQSKQRNRSYIAAFSPKIRAECLIGEKTIYSID